MIMFEYDFFIKSGIVLYIAILIALVIRRTYTIRQHAVSLLSYLSGLFLVYVMFFPLTIEGYPYIRARLSAAQYASPIPFAGLIGALRDTASQGRYLIGPEYPPGTWTTPYSFVMFLVRFAGVQFLGTALLATARLWLDTGRKARSGTLRTILLFLAVIDVLYIADYYLIGLNRGTFDTMFLLFQALGVGVGFLLIRAVGRIRLKTGKSA
ncbi:MAG: hypothetical protein KBA30_10220 [Clostridia bacterium]|nr:hypothetical protein [Clostridia bacterium]